MLRQALAGVWGGIFLEEGDKVEFLHNYAERTVVDVRIFNQSEEIIVPCYDTITGCFPWNI